MLPLLVQWNFERMLADGLLSEREQAFFTDKRLGKFWAKASKYLASVPADYREVAGQSMVGAIITPLAFGYGDTGTADQPTRKVKTRQAQNKADPVISRIAELAGELGDALEELESITTMHPCETRLLHLIQPLFQDEAVQNLSGYWLGVRTHEAMRILERKFQDYPVAADLFEDVPGMKSQRATWRDWLREAHCNLEELNDTYPGELALTESDWVLLAQVLIGEYITRSVVEDALRSCNQQPD